MDLRYIAMITKQKAFNKSLIDQETQVIFLDEAYAGLLEPDDWKVDLFNFDNLLLYIFSLILLSFSNENVLGAHPGWTYGTQPKI